MRRLTASLIASLFALALGLILLTAPAGAVAHPGSTCNPAPGHGRTGCHRVTTPSTATAAAKAKAAAAKRAAAARAAAAQKAAEAAAAEASAAVVPTAPVTEVHPTPPVSVPVAMEAPAPVPWWVALWHYLFG